MPDGKGKYGNLLSEIRQEQGKPEISPPAVFLPEKPPVLHGKRSRPGWRAKNVILNEKTIEEASEKLRRRGDRTDFSDLVQALLEAWLLSPKE